MNIYFYDKGDDELYQVIKTEIAADNKKIKWGKFSLFLTLKNKKELQQLLIYWMFPLQLQCLEN